MRKTIIPILIFAVVVLFTITGTGCKKYVEDKKQQAIDTIMAAIVDGTWYVSKYTQNGSDSTSLFAGWEFKFNSDKTSVANKTGNSSVAGTWNGDLDTYSFIANFNTTPPRPLEKLAGSWLVIRAVTTTKGSFARYSNGVLTNELELMKK